mmetsp:Transcript_34907/g.96363  ORF Transcript_34907/g.96363 Transcript_34907/m.96363 type:complete len:299 (-) Transcript_34907:343-1239(-)
MAHRVVRHAPQQRVLLVLPDVVARARDVERRGRAYVGKRREALDLRVPDLAAGAERVPRWLLELRMPSVVPLHDAAAGGALDRFPPVQRRQRAFLEPPAFPFRLGLCVQPDTLGTHLSKVAEALLLRPGERLSKLPALRSATCRAVASSNVLLPEPCSEVIVLQLVLLEVSPPLHMFHDSKAGDFRKQHGEAVEALWGGLLVEVVEDTHEDAMIRRHPATSLATRQFANVLPEAMPDIESARTGAGIAWDVFQVPGLHDRDSHLSLQMPRLLVTRSEGVLGAARKRGWPLGRELGLRD